MMGARHVEERDVLQICRDLLADCTPLETDCGALCAAACCQPLEAEETGMLLFPGEERFYRDQPDWQIHPATGGLLLICPGHCRREDRPLACRLFPLLPLLRPEGIRVAMDARARAVCPLRQARACREAFVERLRQVGERLQEDPVQRAFLEQLTAQQDALREIQRRFGGA